MKKEARGLSTNQTLRSMAAICVAFILSFTSIANAYTEAELFDEFDARRLTETEKRFLQTALAFVGAYNGTIDGLWGAGSQRSIERYAEKSEISGYVPNWLPALLAGATAEKMRSEGWAETYFDVLDMSFLIPKGNIRAGQDSEAFLNWNHEKSSLGYSLTRGDAEQVLRLHDYTVQQARVGTTPYKVRKDRYWVSSVMNSAGLTLYTRSDYRNGRWSTIMLSTTQADSGIMAAVSGSIRRGRAPDIYLPTGLLSTGYIALDSVLDREKAAPPAAPPPPSATPNASLDAPGATEQRRGSGTGFIVSQTGHVLTNAHVVQDCGAISIEGAPATVIQSDPSIDLALLHGSSLAGQPAAEFSANPAMLNSDVTVVGYPLAGLLGGLNVTRGSLTSLKGVAGDGNRMQISAPVQPGNSGGPVLNAEGKVVGVVVSKLDAMLVKEATGDIPQNVNFAIRGEIAKLFMAQNNVAPVTSARAQRLEPEELAQMASKFTKFVECQ